MNALITLPDWGAPLNGAREILTVVGLPLALALVWSFFKDGQYYRWWRKR